jgi:hypothetical protein
MGLGLVVFEQIVDVPRRRIAGSAKVEDAPGICRRWDWTFNRRLNRFRGSNATRIQVLRGAAILWGWFFV